MKPQEVELVLLEQSLANGSGMNRPFSDRVSDVAEKTDGLVLFDVRVDDDALFQRIAAIGFDEDGTVAILSKHAASTIDGPERCATARVYHWTRLRVCFFTLWRQTRPNR